MQWQMDFRKLKKGDEFAALIREMLDGKREQSQLLGVRWFEGKDYYAIRAEDGKFYDRNGTGLAKGFLRFPTAKQFRISSNFNPRRTNPVTGRVAPHPQVLILPCHKVRQCFQWVTVKWWLPNVVAQQVIMWLFVMVAATPRVICTCARDPGETGTEGETWRPYRAFR